MELKDFGKAYVFTTHIDIGNDGDYVVMREPTTLELKEVGNNEEKTFEALLKVFPNCIIEHSFTVDGAPASNKEVAKNILDSGSIYVNLINVWMESLPLKKKTNKS